MIRKLNATGRRRIPRAAINLHAEAASDGGPFLTIAVNLPPELHDSSQTRVYLDLRRGTFFRRCEIRKTGGSVWDRVSLEGLADAQAIMGHLRVVDGASGQVLAEARRLKPTGLDQLQGESESLLPIQSAKLDGEVWRLGREADESPVLLVSSQLGRLSAVVGNPMFIALVLPEVLRRILETVIRDPGQGDSDDEDDWRTQWRRFAVAHGGHPPDSADEEERSEWVDVTVSRFARSIKSQERFCASLEVAE